MVIRKDGQLPICGDFKVTFNPHLKVPTYPLLTLDEIFATLGNDETFTKLDLLHAYNYVTGFWKIVPNHTITEIHSIA